jgi:hypothetical protein
VTSGRAFDHIDHVCQLAGESLCNRQSRTFDSVPLRRYRRMMKTIVSCFLVATLAAAFAEPIEIGTRRELFVDDHMIQQLLGGAELRLHQPTPREIAIVHDEEWEGTGCGYHSIFKDGELYRMYYKAWHIEVSESGVNTKRHPLFCCYAESDDGVHWRKPKVGLHEFVGSKENNIVIAGGKIGELNVDAGHPAVFLDANPNVAEDARYKAIVRSTKPNGLLPFKSADGLNWVPAVDAPILHGKGAFDSQNLAFWDPEIGKYRAYWRAFSEGETTDKNWTPGGYRIIRTAVSDDLVEWTEHADLTYEDSPAAHLYTNGVQPYHRAPHVLIGLPTRYVDRGESEPMTALPDSESRKLRAAASPRYGHALTDGQFMASRDGRHFKRWNEAFLRPGPERPGTWHYGAHYLGWGVVETASDLPGAPNELSVYATEKYWHGDGSALRRYTLRLDGFVSASADWKGGQLLTKPLTFEGNRLELNFATSAGGEVRVEIQDANGKPVEGFALDDCPPQFGDSVEKTVTWSSGANLAELAGKPVRLLFELKDADLYAFRFQ